MCYFSAANVGFSAPLFLIFICRDHVSSVSTRTERQIKRKIELRKTKRDEMTL